MWIIFLLCLELFLIQSINKDSQLILVQFFFFVFLLLFYSLKDISSDCYLNPSESVQKTNGLNYVQTNRVMDIPVIDCRQEQKVINYNDVDHSRTRALREVKEERTQEKFVFFFYFSNQFYFFLLIRSIK